MTFLFVHNSGTICRTNRLIMINCVFVYFFISVCSQVRTICRTKRLIMINGFLSLLSFPFDHNSGTNIQYKYTDYDKCFCLFFLISVCSQFRTTSICKTIRWTMINDFYYYYYFRLFTIPHYM